MIPYLQILCFAMMWDPINGLNLNLLQVKGYANIFLKIEIIKKIGGVFILGLTIPFGLKAICYGILAINLINLPINTYYTRKFFGYSIISQIKDIWHIVANVTFMGFLIKIILILFNSPLMQLVVGIGMGGITYLSNAYIFRFNEIAILTSFVSPCRQQNCHYEDKR